MDSEQLMNLFHEAHEDIASCGLPVADMDNINVLFNQRIGRIWGNCRRVGYRKYLIKFSEILCNHCSIDGVRSTMAHELIHACGIFGHGKDFKWAAQDVMAKFPGKYSIKRTTSAVEKMTEDELKSAYKYAVECSNCGHVWYFRNMTQSVKAPEFCRCGICKTATLRRKFL